MIGIVKRQCERIAEDRQRFIKGNVVFLEVRSSLPRIPFVDHRRDSTLTVRNPASVGVESASALRRGVDDDQELQQVIAVGVYQADSQSRVSCAG